jgi:hypothetical protein
METIDDTSRHQHRAEAEVPAEETRSHLQTIQEQVVLDVDAETASTGLALEAEHWQWKEAAPMHRYTWALDLRAQRPLANSRMVAILTNNTYVP